MSRRKRYFSLSLEHNLIQNKRKQYHQQNRDDKVDVFIHDDNIRRTEQKDNAGLNQHVERIKAQDARRQDAVVRNRLKDHGRKRNRSPVSAMAATFLILLGKV